MSSALIREPSRTRPMVGERSSGPCDPLDGARTHRSSLLRSRIALVENLSCHGQRAGTTPEGHSAEFQVCLPYRGLFVWHVAGDEVVSDASQVLFVSDGESYRLTEPLPGGYAELIVTPSSELLAELVQTSAERVRFHPLFRRRRRRADQALQLLRARFLHRANDGGWDRLAADELIIALLRSALGTEAPTPEPRRATRRLIGRAKEFVEEHLSEPIRLSDVASSVGASPAYLTDVFRRFEGVPLHRYLLQARLARALVVLPHADDLTALALDLGFSSHSHFTAAFRRAFGTTPSEFRASTRSRPQRRIA
jgi:AraC family transcriptional regulator